MSYITTSGTIITESGSLVQYASSSLIVNATWNSNNQDWLCSVLIVDAATRLIVTKELDVRYTKAQIDALTGTGTGDTAKITNALEQAVKATFLALNGAITFTIV